MTLTLICITPFIIFSKQRSVSLQNKSVSIIAGVFFGFELACWNVAIMESSASMPTLLVNLSSVWVCIGAYIFLREKTTAFHWIGNIIAIFGVVLIIGISQLLKLEIESDILLSICASLFLAVYTLLIKKVRSEIGTLSVLFYALIGSAIPLITICFINKLTLIGYSKHSLIYLIALGRAS